MLLRISKLKRVEMISRITNLYGDDLSHAKGRGVDIASQRSDELDLASLSYISHQCSLGYQVKALDLGGGLGTHSISMASAGAFVTMVDIDDVARQHFSEARLSKGVGSDKLYFQHKDFKELKEDDIPSDLTLLYSNRAIHYLPYLEARKLLQMIRTRMTKEGVLFISAAGWNTEYGLDYPDRLKPVEERFAYLSDEMKRKHGIDHKIVTYKKDEFARLISESGFCVVRIWLSPFGNIKCIGRVSEISRL